MARIDVLPVAHDGSAVSGRKPERKVDMKHVVRLSLGLIIGIGLLVLTASLVNLPAILYVIERHLSTWQGILSALLASIVFLLAFVFRALRWRLFLNPVARVKRITVIRLFLIGVFLNFLVPIRIGELAKALILKRISDVPFGPALSTITMDKVFDLLPAFFIVALVPFLHIQLDSRSWFVLLLAMAVLLSAMLFVLFSAWKQTLALKILYKVVQPLPKVLGSKIEGFATGFVQSVLLSARNPRVFALAAAMTALAVCFDGLYNYFSFWAIGYPITFAQAVFGYMVFNVFYILPSPPGQLGSNEVVGLVIFHGLLHIPAEQVIAMIGLFHVWSGLLMCGAGMASLGSLGVSFGSVMSSKVEEKLYA